jgi:hypothetical protein
MDELRALSAGALKTLVWLRDNQHHFSQWLAGGRIIRRQPKDEWNQIEFRGRDKSHRTSSKIWDELRPYTKVSDDISDRMFVPNDAGTDLLAALNL